MPNVELKVDGDNIYAVNINLEDIRSFAQFTVELVIQTCMAF
jgi:hypothetical protein